jgi:hypothetical protein
MDNSNPIEKYRIFLVGYIFFKVIIGDHPIYLYNF